jgi:hypothetical protein
MPRERSVARTDRLAKKATALPGAVGVRGKQGEAATVAVTNCNDDGDGSLRNAVENIALSGDTVDMGGLTCSTITLTSGAITTGVDDLTIVGPGTDMNGVTLLASHNSQIFVHLGHGTLALEYMTVINGGAYGSYGFNVNGGCVYSAGLVALHNTGVKYCVAESQGAASAAGGGVYAKLGVEAVSSTIAGNAAQGHGLGGGIFTLGSLYANYSWFHSNAATGHSGFGGALLIRGDATIINSTVSGNTAAGPAGVALLGSYASHDLEIRNTTLCDNYSYDSESGSGLFVGAPILVSNSTITGNVARNSSNTSRGAGIDMGFSSAATLQSTIVSGNSLYDGTTHIHDDIGYSSSGGALVGGANNLVGHSTLPLSLDTIVTDDPRLGALTTGNGGPTPTKAPLRDSSAINHGNNLGDSRYDQRGPGFARVIGRLADIGAVESDVIFSSGFD